MSAKTLNVIYWATTLVFAAFLTWSAVQYVTGAPKMIAAMTHLGYPMYFITGLGIAKLLGVAALVFGPGRLKEWAYAGFTFDLIGASVSHASSGDGAMRASIPLLFLALLAVSYVTERARHTAPAGHDRLVHAHA